MSSKNNRLNKPIALHRERKDVATGAVLKRLVRGPQQYRMKQGRIQKAITTRRP
jgi:hypothetical protein